jgi:Zn-dependent M28 family amino/carboxypeptidase
MAHEHYALLHRLATAKDAAPVTVEVEITNKLIPGPIPVYNTVGEVRGGEFPDEVVVVGAHLDSWDLASGTTDNGTGSSVVLEAARVLAKLASEGHRPKRTIRFVLFTGEEQGLHGSRKYTEMHAAELPKHAAAIVHDTGTGKVQGFGLLQREAVRKVLEPELAVLKEVDGWKGLTLGGMTGSTDHWPFEQKGVPGFAAQQDAYEYRLTHHTQSDTLDKAVPANLVQGATVMAITATRIANLPTLLTREKPLIRSFGGRGGFPRPEEKKDEAKPGTKKE